MMANNYHITPVDANLVADLTEIRCEILMILASIYNAIYINIALKSVAKFMRNCNEIHTYFTTIFTAIYNTICNAICIEINTGNAHQFAPLFNLKTRYYGL